MKITVLGAGAWGTALAIHLARRHPVMLWARDTAHIETMRVDRTNQRYLGDYPFPEHLQLESDLHTGLRWADLILSVVPTSGVRGIMREIKAARSQAPVVWANKGLERDTALLLHELAEEELPFGQAWGILSGPSFASDLSRGLPTAMTLASTDAAFAQTAAAAMHGDNVRVYTSQDVVGVAVGGALKNVMAIAAGICDGMEFGNNARAALITRGLAEITRFGLSVGGRGQTFMGLAGAGDLILTCTGDSSRNRTVGLRLARGETLDQIITSLGHVAEGVHTTREVFRRAQQLGVDMPITTEVNRVLSEGLSPREAVENLLSREQKAEHY
jgi:glycerol-3-phosphate dehydrogenase (NAD(P)+)